MTINKRVSLKNANIFFLSLGGVGFAKWAPGTMGSLATIPLLYLLGKLSLPFCYLLFITCALTILASFSAEHIQKKLKLHDPQWIVFDETLGMLTCWLFHPTSSLLYLAVMFVLFRFFDIVKVWPANFVDSKIKHGCGTILDDTISGIYAGLCFLIFLKIF